MTLRALIRRSNHGGLNPSVTVTVVTVVTVATVQAPTHQSVASVATVTVAAVRPSTSAADPWAPRAGACHLGLLHQCRACGHFMDTIPADGDDLGVQDAGWCMRYDVAAHPLVPFVCDGYSPGPRDATE